MKEQYSIKDGRTEAVMWIVYRRGKFLVEDRPRSLQGESRCIPCGHIDLNRDKGNYIEAAFLRESQEEFETGNFKPTRYRFLTTIDFNEHTKDGGVDKFRLHYFVVTQWSGIIPEYSNEHGKKQSKLVWLEISKTQELPQSCDRKAIKILRRQLK